jgi:asparagine synthase (glutamine-hydrolysing)
MCGIFGAIGDADESRAKYALKLLSHRGPDFQDFHHADGNFLGHTRLSIIDLSDSGNQPMHSACGRYTIIFNGEIYNYQQLKKGLDYPFKSSSDTEVILALFSVYGEDFVSRLKGMFAIAIYDHHEKSLWLFRDRYGKKPLYYTFHKGTFIFASEIKSITAYTGEYRFNRDAIVPYLSLMSCSGSCTFFKNINKIEAGHRLRLKDGTADIRPYYNLLENIRPNGDSFDKAVVNVRELLHESIGYRLVSDAEVGMMLSGGLDSSYITAVASQIKKHGFKTFTIGYKEYEQYDETEYARQMADYTGAEHHEYRIDSDEFYKVVDKVVYHMDEPVNDPAMVPTYILSGFIRDKGIKVVLTGEGSDELFLGYDYYFDLLNRLRSREKACIGAPFETSRMEASRARQDDGMLAYHSFAETFTPAQIESILGYSGHGSVVNERYQAFFHSGLSGDTFWLSYVDFMVWIQNVLLMKLDKMSMANSVEFRAPFLDHDLVHYVFSLPERSRLSEKYRTKGLLKSAAIGILPEEIISRRKKGFSSPFIEWFFDRGLDEEIWEFNKQTEIFEPSVAEDLLNKARGGKNKLHIWGMFILARWYRMNIEGR